MTLKYVTPYPDSLLEKSSSSLYAHQFFKYIRYDEYGVECIRAHEYALHIRKGRNYRNEKSRCCCNVDL